MAGITGTSFELFETAGEQTRCQTVHEHGLPNWLTKQVSQLSQVTADTSETSNSDLQLRGQQIEIVALDGMPLSYHDHTVTR